jgi:hypothetical protein
MQIHAPILAAAESPGAPKFGARLYPPPAGCGASACWRPGGAHCGKTRRFKPSQNAEIASLSPVTMGVQRPKTTKQQFP